MVFKNVKPSVYAMPGYLFSAFAPTPQLWQRVPYEVALRRRRLFPQTPTPTANSCWYIPTELPKIFQMIKGTIMLLICMPLQPAIMVVFDFLVLRYLIAPALCPEARPRANAPPPTHLKVKVYEEL